MGHYRAYIVDDEKIFKSFQEFEARDDGAALRNAERLVTDKAVELWEGRRLIGRLNLARHGNPAHRLAHI